MHTVTSKDGTPIAYDRLGSGPAVVLVGGAFNDRSKNAPLATELAAHFTVYNYDRRGRGDSGDTLPYAVEREVEDIDALVAEAGGLAHLYGLSSGGALALTATAAGTAVDRLAVYEVPYNMADDGPRQQQEYVERLTALLADDRRGDAAELFMRLVGASDDMVAGARQSTIWPGLEAIAHTLAYDAACLGDSRPPVDRLATITRPTLVATGGASPESFVSGGGDFFDLAADAIAAAVPRAQREVLDGQTHLVDPKALAPVLVRFFDAATDTAARAYVDAIAAQHRPLFDRIHRLVVRAYPDAALGLSYQLPTYRVGRRRLHVGVWKHGVSIYGWDQERDGGFTDRHPQLSSGKGTIRLRPADADDISDDELRGLVESALGD
ncbi:MAG: alpha/beta fold hydrolase [Streptosporangiales bacterium]|nr:alpha/beta fold hydrolase [Streptosporangiales bacterium]